MNNVMTKPFAITLDVGSSLANKTGSWRTARPVYLDRLPPCNNQCPAGENIQSWLFLAEARADLRWQVSEKLRFVGDAPVLPVSALSGKGVHKLFPALETSVDAYRRRIPTAKVNAVIRDAQMAQAAPGGARVLYATQGASHPPTFTLFVNRALPQPYMRYLERKLREAFDLGATAVKLRVRRRGE